MNCETALIIFVRKPELGKVKTRLAAQIGNEKALDIYIRLLKHIEIVALETDAQTYIFATEKYEHFTWNNSFVEIQYGNNLGERMSNAFGNVFKKGYKKVLIIGSDCPGLHSTHITKAFSELDDHDIVIGPARDGGYYLLGMKKLSPSIFENIIWSTATVLADTIKNIATLKQSHYELETLIDIDEEKDLPETWK